MDVGRQRLSDGFQQRSPPIFIALTHTPHEGNEVYPSPTERFDIRK